jgi:hypothetical protein
MSNDDLPALAEQWATLRSTKGHFQDGEYNSDVDGFNGKKHKLMQDMQKILKNSLSSDIISALGSPDQVTESLDTNVIPLMMPGPVIAPEVAIQTGPMLVSGPVYLIYYWRGKHDYLWFKVESSNGQAVDSGWYHALE